MARLPTPGGDNGNWGDILNDYLSQAHKSDGTLKDNAVTSNVLAPNSITNAAIANDAVNTSSIADGSITEVLLDGGVQTKLNQAAPTWSTLSGKPAVVAAGADAAVAQDAINAVGRDQLMLNILDFGVTRGTTSSQTVAIKAALDANPGEAFYFPPGDYRLDTQLNVTANNSIILAAGARIYAAAAMDTLINYDNGQASVSNYAQDKCIIGEGILDGSLLASKVLSISRVIRMTVEGFTIVDGINRGLYTVALGAEIAFRNVRIHNTGTTNVTDNIAIEANMGDCSFQDFIIRDCTVAVRDNGSNVWINVHPWLGTTSQLTVRYENSICFDMNSDSVLIAPYADTYRVNFKVRASARARISQARVYANSGNLTTGLAASYSAVVLDMDTTSYVNFVGASLQGHSVTPHVFLSGVPTRLTSHTNIVKSGITGYSDYQDGTKYASSILQDQTLPRLLDAFTAADGAALDSAKWTVAIGSAAAAVINGNRARFTTGATGSYNINDRINISAVTASLTDAEILVRHTLGTPTIESYMYYGLRISGSNVRSANSYCAILTQPGDGLTLAKFVAGVSTDFGGVSFASLGLAPSSVNPTKWLRFRVKGTTISAKVWDDGTAEPVAWSKVVTDSSVSAAGTVGAQFSGGSAAISGVNYVDRFSVYSLEDDTSFVEAIANGLDNKQPLDVDLTAIATLASAANKVPYATGTGTWALTDFTAAGRALVDDADTTEQRGTLGLGNVDNTSDMNKPVSTAQATALGLKQPKPMTGTVSTVAVTTTKTVTLDSPWASATPVAGDELYLTWTNGNNTGSPTLAVNGGSSFPIATGSGGTSGVDLLFGVGYSTRLQFDGTRWVNQTPALITLSEISNSDILNSSGTYRLMSGLRAAYLKRKAINTTVVSSATPAISLDLGDWATIAVGHNITAITTTGTGNDLQTINLKLVGTGAFTLAFGSTWSFGFSVAAPTSIANGKTIYISGRWNSTTSKIDVLDVKQEA